MSEENLEIVRRGYAAMNDRDTSRIPEFLDPEVEIDLSRNIMNADVYRGWGGFEKLVGVVEDVWADFRFEPEELIDGGDSVVARIRISGTGRESGIRAEMHVFNVLRLRDGKLLSLIGGFRDRAEALEAAGITE